MPHNWCSTRTRLWRGRRGDAFRVRHRAENGGAEGRGAGTPRVQTAQARATHARDTSASAGYPRRSARREGLRTVSGAGSARQNQQREQQRRSMSAAQLGYPPARPRPRAARALGIHLCRGPLWIPARPSRLRRLLLSDTAAPVTGRDALTARAQSRRTATSLAATYPHCVGRLLPRHAKVTQHVEFAERGVRRVATED